VKSKAQKSKALPGSKLISGVAVESQVFTQSGLKTGRYGKSTTIDSNIGGSSGNIGTRKPKDPSALSGKGGTQGTGFFDDYILGYMTLS
jgi:hypothetical protein